MTIPVEVELANGLFPQALIHRMTAAGEFPLTVVATDETTATVRLNLTGADEQDARDTACELLTAAAVRYWTEAGPTDATGAANTSPPRRVDMTLRLIDEDEPGARIMMAVNPRVHDPVELLRTLAPLQGQVRLRMESTNPVDRFALTVLLRKADSVGPAVLELVKSLFSSHAVERIPSVNVRNDGG